MHFRAWGQLCAGGGGEVSSFFFKCLARWEKNKTFVSRKRDFVLQIKITFISKLEIEIILA